MTSAEEQDIKNLIEGARNMKELYQKTNQRGNAEIEAIRTFAIEAVKDYNETAKTLVSLINSAHDLFPEPFVRGTEDYSKHHHCVLSPLKEEYEYTTGTFDIYHEKYSPALCVFVKNIKGRKVFGYCGSADDKPIESKDWVATGVALTEVEKTGCKGDLIDETFNSAEGERNLHYTEENLKRFNWSIDGWVSIKKMAEKTRKRTQAMVDYFKKSLQYHAEINKEKMNNLSSASAGIYVKVSF